MPVLTTIVLESGVRSGEWEVQSVTEKGIEQNRESAENPDHCRRDLGALPVTGPQAAATTPEVYDVRERTPLPWSRCMGSRRARGAGGRRGQGTRGGGAGLTVWWNRRRSATAWRGGHVRATRGEARGPRTARPPRRSRVKCEDVNQHQGEWAGSGGGSQRRSVDRGMHPSTTRQIPSRPQPTPRPHGLAPGAARAVHAHRPTSPACQHTEPVITEVRDSGTHRPDTSPYASPYAMTRAEAPVPCDAGASVSRCHGSVHRGAMSVRLGSCRLGNPLFADCGKQGRVVELDGVGDRHRGCPSRGRVGMFGSM